MIIGGTRLVGLALVKALAEKGMNVLVLSRKPAPYLNNVRSLQMDKALGLRTLKHEYFDFVFDFLCYGVDDVKDVKQHLKFSAYFMISSVWLNHIEIASRDGSKMPSLDQNKVTALPEATRNYLLAKFSAEQELIANNTKTGKIIIIRLPIFFGEYEHSNRLNFYTVRLKNDQPSILVNNGKNIIQIAWTEDIANILVPNLDKIIKSDITVWEALPNEGLKLSKFLFTLAEVLDVKPNFISISAQELKKNFPSYLIEEPLWRETAIKLTSHNLFLTFKTDPTPEKTWLNKIAFQQNKFSLDNIRNQEIDFLKNYN